MNEVLFDVVSVARSAYTRQLEKAHVETEEVAAVLPSFTVWSADGRELVQATWLPVEEMRTRDCEVAALMLWKAVPDAVAFTFCLDSRVSGTEPEDGKGVLAVVASDGDEVIESFADYEVGDGRIQYEFWPEGRGTTGLFVQMVHGVDRMKDAWVDAIAGQHPGREVTDLDVITYALKILVGEDGNAVASLDEDLMDRMRAHADEVQKSKREQLEELATQCALLDAERVSQEFDVDAARTLATDGPVQFSDQYDGLLERCGVGPLEGEQEDTYWTEFWISLQAHAEGMIDDHERTDGDDVP